MQLPAAAATGRRALLALALGLVPASGLALEAPAAAPPAEVAPPAARVADPAPDPLAAWAGPGTPSERAERARLAALQVGVASFDAPARAVLRDPAAGTLLERARHAVTVAPGLPLAQASLAQALLGEFDPLGAMGAAGRALAALARHREARFWAEATAALALRDALFFGGLLFLALVAVRHGRPAAHDLGDRFAGAAPLFARAGLLGVLLLVPPMLGQGLLGLALSLVALAVARGDRRERRAALAAALLVLLGLEGATRLSARALVAFEPDAVAAATLAVERGVFAAPDLEILERSQSHDPLAVRGLAIAARRAGRLQEAAARYDSLLDAGRGDAALANNAGNVAMALGNAERAVTFYQLAEGLGGDPVVLYNLSYGYGEAIRPSLQDETLQRLQHRDPQLAHALMELQAKLAGGFTLDLPLPVSVLRARAAEGDLVAVTAAELERPLAPGALGRQPALALAALLAAVLAGLGAARYRRSGACRQCGARICPRCDAPSPARDLCTACHRLLRRPETADPELRSRRLSELERRSRRLARLRNAAAWIVPGAAGVLAGRPLLGLCGAVAGVAALAFAVAPGALVVDPLAAGGAGVLAFGLASAACLAVYGATVWRAFSPRGAEVEP